MYNHWKSIKLSVLKNMLQVLIGINSFNFDLFTRSRKKKKCPMNHYSSNKWICWLSEGGSTSVDTRVMHSNTNTNTLNSIEYEFKFEYTEIILIRTKIWIFLVHMINEENLANHFSKPLLHLFIQDLLLLSNYWSEEWGWKWWRGSVHIPLIWHSFNSLLLLEKYWETWWEDGRGKRKGRGIELETRRKQGPPCVQLGGRWVCSSNALRQRGNEGVRDLASPSHPSAAGRRGTGALPRRSHALAVDLFIFSIYEEENFMFSPIEAANYYLMVFNKSRGGRPRWKEQVGYYVRLGPLPPRPSPGRPCCDTIISAVLFSKCVWE